MSEPYTSRRSASRIGRVASSMPPAPNPPGTPPEQPYGVSGSQGVTGAALPRLKSKATRTYTGEALARRQAWGRTWAAYQREIGRQLRQREDG